MKVLRIGGCAAPSAVIGKAFQCGDCSSVFQIEAESEIRPGTASTVTLFATCPVCGAAACVVSGPRVFSVTPPTGGAVVADVAVGTAEEPKP